MKKMKRMTRKNRKKTIVAYACSCYSPMVCGEECGSVAAAFDKMAAGYALISAGRVQTGT